jgi:26S proteasome regulatory subunit N5
MKIMIKRSDFIRLFIISKKINEANLNDDELVDLKVRYYAYMAIYYNQENKYYETAKCYKTLWESLKKTNKIELPQKSDFDFSIAYFDVLANYLGFLVLEPFSEKQKTELEALYNSEEIEGIPHIYQLVSAFLSRELVSCDLNDYGLERFELYTEKYLNFANHRETIRNMLIQHNIKVMSECYERLSMPRIGNLISVPQEDA